MSEYINFYILNIERALIYFLPAIFVLLCYLLFSFSSYKLFALGNILLV